MGRNKKYTEEEKIEVKKNYYQEHKEKILEKKKAAKDRLFDIPTKSGRQSKEATKNFLLRVIFNDLDRLSSLPKAHAALKRTFYRKMIESL